MNHREKDLLTRVQFGRPVKLWESRLRESFRVGLGFCVLSQSGRFFLARDSR